MINLAAASDFLDILFLEALRAGIDVSYYELDHICYRVESAKEYKENKKYLGGIGNLLSETEIEGRPIATYRLHHPIHYQNREIYVLELPFPKKDNRYKTGFEHVEFVIDEGFDAFMKGYPELEFQKKALSKKINPDISISFGDIAVKFHRDTLENVIKFEQQ